MPYRKPIFISILFFLVTGVSSAFMPVHSLSKTFLQKENGQLKEVTLISVYDNLRLVKELKTSWGFGSVVKTPYETLLFDTGGDSEILLFNMKKLEIDPRSIDKVIISHIHADHVGGLKGFLEKNNNVTVFIPSTFPDAIRNGIISQGARFINVSAPTRISENVFSTGELYGPPIEQSLIIRAHSGLIVMTGCGHPGIVNIVSKAQDLFPKSKVYLGVGGFHHPPVSVARELRKLGVRKIAPSHCTGSQAIETFKKEYKDDFIDYGAGKVIFVKDSE